MEAIALKVTKREGSGTGASRRLRHQGLVPGVFYGPNVGEPIDVVFEERTFVRSVLMNENAQLLRFESETAELDGRLVSMREVQVHPVTRTVMHSDFYELDPKRKVPFEIALHFIGKAKGIDLGGILQPIRRELEVLCLPNDVPQAIEIDVTHLDVHDSIHVEDIVLPPNVEAVFDQNFTIVTVAAPTVSEAPKTEAEGTEGAIATGGEVKEGADKEGE